MAGLRLVHHGSSFVAASLLLSSAAMAFDDFAARAHQAASLPGAGAVRSLALQLDGSAVLGTGSDGRLLRYLGDGTLDRLPIDEEEAPAGTLAGAVVGLAVQPDGRLIALFAEDGAYTLRRWRSSGAVDAGFGEGGAIRMALGQGSRIDALAVPADGSLIVAGQESVTLDDGTVRWNPIVVRHRADGGIDASFGDGGVARLELDNRAVADVALAPQADGRIVLASAVRTPGAGAADILVARLRADGAPDPGFGDGGQGIVRFGADEVDERAGAVLIQPDGGIVVAGTAGGDDAGALVLLRLRADGRRDPGFADAGLLRVEPGASGCGSARALVQLPDQTLLVAGGWRPDCAGDADLLLLGVAADGRVQARRTIDLGGDERAHALAAQPNGEVLLAGGGPDTAAVVRYALGEPPPLWDLEPDGFQFGNENGAQGLRTLVSPFHAVEGFDAGVYLPLHVRGGEYALNGASEYTGVPGWVRLGDEISVRHVARAKPQESMTTRVTVGGVQAPNNLATTIGPVAVLEFTSVTGSLPEEADGGGAGADGLFVLAALTLAAAARRTCGGTGDGVRDRGGEKA